LGLGFPRGRFAANPAWQWPAALAIFSVCFWVAATGVVNPTQYADSIEQFNWAHGLELGYWKHPPLTTWLMRAAIALAGPSDFVSYVLAAVCYSGTAYFTWKIASMLMPARAAALAVLLLSLHHGFSWRAQIYNHNAVLVLMASAFVWATMRAVRSGRRFDWLAAGALAGLAMLAKYQAVIPIVCVLLGLWHSGVLRQQAARRNLALASALGALVFLPHAVWALQHGIPTLRYLQHSAPPIGPGSRELAWLNFFANQVSLNFSMLLAAAVLALWCGKPAAHASETGPLPIGSWLFALVLMPVVVVSAVILLGGITPQKYWGLQTLQFFPLLLASRLQRGWREVPLGKAAGLCIAISAAGAAYYVAESTDAQAVSKLHSMDRVWPAKELAAAALADWQAATDCPLKYVVGPSFPAGLVSVYSGLYPAVLEAGDQNKSPWIDAADLQEAGALIVSGPLPIDQPLASDMHSFAVPAKPSEGGRAQVQWAILAPHAANCAPTGGP